MSLANDLLDTAKRLLATAATEADLRRSISTAYYALFHRLIEAAVGTLVAQPDQQQLLARQFSHTEMKKVCQLATKSPLPPHGLPFFGPRAPVELEDLATAFVKLQDRRHDADYNRGWTVTPAEAHKLVRDAEDAFAKWPTIEALPVARPFLLLLLVGEPKVR